MNPAGLARRAVQAVAAGRQDRLVPTQRRHQPGLTRDRGGRRCRRLKRLADLDGVPAEQPLDRLGQVLQQAKRESRSCTT